MTQHARSNAAKGFSLLELLLASALALVVLAGGVGVATGLQRRSQLEQEVMSAQVAGRALKEVLASELAGAGAGMKNAQLTFSGLLDQRLALNVLHEPNLASAAGSLFPADSSFALPPAPYLASDALQLWWSDLDTLLQLTGCFGESVIQPGGVGACTRTPVNPSWSGVPVMLVNPDLGAGCSVTAHAINAWGFTFQPGMGNAGATSGLCTTLTDAAWTRAGWRAMRVVGSAWRVNWASGEPVLEYDRPETPPGDWTAVSRAVERMKVRQAVVDPSTGVRRWFPDPETGRTRALSQCTLLQMGAGGECAVPWLVTLPTTDDALRAELGRQVQELEVTLTLRTRHSASELRVEGAPPDADEGFPQDGFKRRTFTFRVTPRNFLAP